MKKNIIKIALFILSTGFMMTSCHDDLDQFPQDKDSFTELDVFKDATSAKQALAKVYSAFALTGQKGPSGSPDILGLDEGASQFTRVLFNLNESTTDNAIVWWGDPGLPDLHYQTWSSDNTFTRMMYYRLAQQISFSNSFIEKAADLAATDNEVKNFVEEARFCRAYAYYWMLDMYGNVPIVTKISLDLPKQNTRKEVYDFVETELLALSSSLPATNEYGRVNSSAANAMLSRLYLNAEVYTGTEQYTKAMEYAKKVIDESGKTIKTSNSGDYNPYASLFLADNNSNGAENEFIWTVNFDGLNSQTYGGTTFMTKATSGGSMPSSSLLGINGSWGGYRTTPEFVALFDESQTATTTWSDDRASFYTDGQSLEIPANDAFTKGYAIIKYRNLKSTGAGGNDSSGEHADCDIPLIRLAEIYLNYAEAAVRKGNTAEALTYINELRERAGAETLTSLTLDDVLDERGRELYWEGFRRTDLIRYGYFTTATKLWAWKGGVATGVATASYRNLFPLPLDVIQANSNLTQNPGY